MQLIRGAQKAVVALVAPLVSVWVTDVAADVEVWVAGAVASVVTAALVWLTPNKQPEGKQ